MRSRIYAFYIINSNFIIPDTYPPPPSGMNELSKDAPNSVHNLPSFRLLVKSTRLNDRPILGIILSESYFLIFANKIKGKFQTSHTSFISYPSHQFSWYRKWQIISEVQKCDFQNFKLRIFILQKRKGWKHLFQICQTVRRQFFYQTQRNRGIEHQRGQLGSDVL